jgi:hypothetical protein
VKIRRIVLTLLLAAFAVRTPARAAGQIGDSVSLESTNPALRLPLIAGQENQVTLALTANLASKDSAPLRLVARAEGNGDPVPIGDVVEVQRGTTQVTVSADYKAPATGPRWLTIQAILGPSTWPLAQSDPATFVVMNISSGAHADVYSSPLLSPDLAQAYASDFDAIWQQVGAIFNSYESQPQVILLPADFETFEATLLSLDYTAADATARRQAAEANQISALNHSGAIIFSVPNTGPTADPLTLAHEYTETRVLALQPGNQGAGWFWDGLAETVAFRLAPLFTDAGCGATSKAMSYWRTAMMAVRDDTYVPLADITTQAQWIANYKDDARQYAEGYTAVQYWQQRFGFDSLVQFVAYPKEQPDDFDSAFWQILGIDQSQFESDYVAAMHRKLDSAPLTIPVTVHLDSEGVTPATFVYLTSSFGEESGATFRTPPGLPPGDYSFEIESDGTVASTDGRTQLTQLPYSFPAADQGRLYLGIEHPSYEGQSGFDGAEVLRLDDLYGRAGLSRQYYFVNSTSAAESTPGNCLSPWPDGNQISVSIPTNPSDGMSGR